MIAYPLCRALKMVAVGSLFASLVIGEALASACRWSMVTPQTLLQATVIAGAGSIVLSMVIIVTQTNAWALRGLHWSALCIVAALLSAHGFLALFQLAH